MRNDQAPARAWEQSVARAKHWNSGLSFEWTSVTCGGGEELSGREYEHDQTDITVPAPL